MSWITGLIIGMGVAILLGTLIAFVEYARRPYPGDDVDDNDQSNDGGFDPNIG